MASTASNPAARSALARIGASVRARLAADPAAWRVPVEAAEIFAIGQFLSPAECQRFMALVDAVAAPSPVFESGEAPGAQAGYRTSYSGDVDARDPFVRMIARRIDDLLGIDPAFGESLQGQRYTEGQEFHAHHDWFDVSAAYWPEQERRGGQRSWTAMIYLNDVAAGGQTTFPLLGVTVPPQQGTLLVWNNMSADGTPNPATRHAALAPQDSTKYVVTRWYRARPWC